MKFRPVYIAFIIAFFVGFMISNMMNDNLDKVPQHQSTPTKKTKHKHTGNVSQCDCTGKIDIDGTPHIGSHECVNCNKSDECVPNLVDSVGSDNGFSCCGRGGAETMVSKICGEKGGNPDLAAINDMIKNNHGCFDSSYDLSCD